MPKKANRSTKTKNKKRKKRSKDDAQQSDPKALLRTILSLRMPRCSICTTGWYGDNSPDNEDAIAVDVSLSSSVSFLEEKVKEFVPLPHCECFSTLICMSTDDNADADTDANIDADANVDPINPTSQASILERAENLFRLNDTQTKDGATPGVGVISKFLLDELLLRTGESSAPQMQIQTRRLPHRGMCRSCLKKYVDSSQDINTLDYRCEHQPNPKFTVEPNCPSCRQRFSARTLGSILQGKTKNKGGDLDDWWKCVTDTVRMVHLLKRIRRILKRYKFRADDDVFRPWLHDDDDHSSDDCVSDATDTEQDRQIVLQRKNRIEAKPGEIKNELLKKDPKFRQEWEDQEFIRNKTKTKEGRLELGLEAGTDEGRIEQEEMDAQIAGKMQKEIDQVMKRKDRPSRSKGKKYFFRAQSNTPHMPSSNSELEVLPKTNSTRTRSSRATIGSCTKDSGRKLSTPPSKTRHHRKRNSSLAESPSICDHFQSASSSKQTAARKQTNKRPRTSKNLNNVCEPPKRVASNNSKGVKNVIHLKPLADMSSSSSSDSSSSSSDSSSSSSAPSRKRQRCDSTMGKKRTFNANAKKGKHNPMQSGDAGNNQIDQDYSIDSLESQDVINISDSEMLQDRESRRCKRGSTNQISDATKDPPNFTNSTEREMLESGKDFSTSSSTSRASANLFPNELLDNDEVVLIKPRRNTGRDIENAPSDTEEEDEINSLIHTAEVKPTKLKGRLPAVPRTPVSTQDNDVSELYNTALVSLIEMGFPPTRCRTVLRDAKNDLTLAASMILSEMNGR